MSEEERREMLRVESVLPSLAPVAGQASPCMDFELSLMSASHSISRDSTHVGVVQ
jgi:hypothetical protein